MNDLYFVAAGVAAEEGLVGTHADDVVTVGAGVSFVGVVLSSE